MRTNLVLTAVTTLAATSLAVTALAAPAGATPSSTPVLHLTGSAAGSTLTGAGGLLTSGPTAAAGVDTLAGRTSVPRATNRNAIGTAAVPGVATLGAVTTAVGVAPSTGGATVTAHARTAGVNLLNGSVVARAVDTTAIIALAGGQLHSRLATTFAGLAVGGRTLPATSRPNTRIVIPKVATVVLNYQQPARGAATSSVGAGAVITLLGGTGATIVLNPVDAGIGQVGPGYRLLGGSAFVTSATAQVAKGVQVYSGPTGSSSVPLLGTGGKDVTNNTAGLHAAPLATAQAIGSTANGTTADAGSAADETARLTSLSLLDGTITADAITAHAHIAVTGTDAATTTASSQFAKLVIGGQAVPADAAPNTVVQVPGLGTVVVNAQSRTDHSVAVAALIVRLSTAKYGLPAGAKVEVGFATVSFV